MCYSEEKFLAEGIIMDNAKNKKAILIIIILLLGCSYFLQYRTNQLLTQKATVYEEKTQRALHHLIKNADAGPFVDSLHQVLQADKTAFARHFIQSEKLAEEWYETLVLMNELRDVNTDPSDSENLTSLHLSGFFYSLKHKYYYFDQQLQPEDKLILKKLAKEIAKLDQELKTTREMLANDYPPERQKQIVSNLFGKITPILKEIKKALASYEGQGAMKAQLKEAEAINQIVKSLNITDQYVTHSELKQSNFNHITHHPVYDIRFVDKATSSEEYVAHVDAVTGKLVFYYDQAAALEKDQYAGKTINNELKTILIDVAQEAAVEIKGQKEIIIPEGKFLPEESEVWVVQKTNGFLDFSKVITLSINGSAKKVYRYTNSGSDAAVPDISAPLESDEVQARMNQQLKNKDVTIGSKVITYSHYRKKPVLAYIVKVDQNYHLVNAHTAKTELIVNDTAAHLYRVIQDAF